MSSINEHIITLQKELRNINIPSTFIEEFLDNYLDQLESMKEEIMSEEKVGLQEAENIVLNQCDPIIDVINRVLETYDSRETPAILSPGSIISFTTRSGSCIIIGFPRTPAQISTGTSPLSAASSGHCNS